MTRNGFHKLLISARSYAVRWQFLLSGAAILATCLTARYYWGAPLSHAQAPAIAAPATAQPAQAPQSLIPPHKSIPDIVALVNGQSITREELAQECRQQYGKEVLEAMVNKALILQECRQRGITVTRDEVDHEIQTMAKSFNMSPEQWLRLLLEERHVRPEQYAEDIVWPSIALKKLAGSRLEVTQAELNAAYETQYGPSIQARVIICASLQKAQEARGKAADDPKEFGNLAKIYSIDAPSACVQGLIQPIHKNGPCPEVERAAFALADGQVSDVIPSAGQFVIVKREQMIPGSRITLDAVRPRLEKIISEHKLRGVAGDIFKQLQQRARVQNVYNDPQRRMIYGPGVVAVINDAPIYLRQLDEECMDRHGGDILDSLVNRRLVEDACRSQNVIVTEKDIDAEVARSAKEMMTPLPDGSPDVKKWMAVVCKNQGVTADVYRRSVVWPAAALRKMAAGKVEVTEDDIGKSFNANYGPRVKCRAIVLNNQRRAVEVWDKARQAKTADEFGALAAKYSVEGSSRALQGEVPPIRHDGGQPMLEEEAFKLQAGQISGVIPLDDKFVILFCEGYTKPIDLKLASVRDLLIADIREKKQRMAMANYFGQLQDSASISNFVDPRGNRSPRKTAAAAQSSAVVPASYAAPAMPNNYAAPNKYAAPNQTGRP